MPLDSLLISGLARELNAALAGARIDKIHQPARDRVVIHLRGLSGAQRLLISAGSDARVHLTDMKTENPDVPPAFCVQMRRHIGGGRILCVRQPGHERIIEIDISSSDELGDISQKTLVCEMTGRMTNVILLGEDGIILACMKAVAPGGEHRPVMPGLKYRLPPAQQKPSVFDMSRADFAEICENASREALYECVSAKIGGLPPLFLREIICRARGDAHALARQLFELKTLEPRPFMVMDGLSRADFSAMEIWCADGKTSELWLSFSALLDDFYRERTETQAVKNAASSAQKAILAVKNRLVRKISGQKQELLDAQKREALKNRADLITANLHAIAPGSSSVSVVDYFAEGMPETKIALDPLLTPQQNAQRLYKKYARQKNAEQALAEQIEKGERELEYVENVLYSLSAARAPSEIEDIRRELVDGGYIKDKAKVKKRPKSAAFAPREYDLGGGFTAFCGRNNVENDRLTLREAQKLDLWLHARNIPGAHVVIRADSREIPEEIIERAAQIAAYFSSTCSSPRVAVDYTLAKNVKKIAGAGPGMVTYSSFKTANVHPALPEKEQ